MKIPEISKRIKEISYSIESDYSTEAEELRYLAEEMRRRPSTSRAAITSTPMTEELAQEIKEYHDANPGLSHQKIGERFNVNHGRVSEIINGKRI